MSVRRSIAKFDKHPLMQFFTITCCRRLASGTDCHAAANSDFSSATNGISDQQGNRRQIKRAIWRPSSRNGRATSHASSVVPSCRTAAFVVRLWNRNRQPGEMESGMPSKRPPICRTDLLDKRLCSKGRRPETLGSGVRPPYRIPVNRECSKEECLRRSDRRQHSGSQADLFAGKSRRR